MSESKSGNSVSFLGLLFLLFLTLKLTHVIAWSWWLVTLPLWGGGALILAILVLAGLLGGVYALAKALRKKSSGRNGRRINY